MNRENEFDLVVGDAIERHFPELLADLTEYARLWIKAQIWQESRFRPDAVSSAGAMGLMQLMPATAEERGVLDPFDVVENINGGVGYLAEQYRRLAEIPNYRERLRFALASYNGGRGYVNAALSLARQEEGLPAGFARWERQGRTPGFWQRWDHARDYLADSRCVVDSRRPDHRQMADYVHKIEGRYSQYLETAGLDREHQAWR